MYSERKCRRRRSWQSRLSNLAEKQNDPPRRIAAHRTLVSTSFWRGAFVEAHQHCERVVALYKSEPYQSLAPVYGLDPVAVALSIGAWALWYLGYPDQALKRGEDNLALARQIGHCYSIAGALDTVAWTYAYCRKGKKAIELADEGIALSIAQESALTCHGHMDERLGANHDGRAWGRRGTP